VLKASNCSIERVVFLCEVRSGAELANIFEGA
jgi:hypothetical protein